MKLLKLSFIIAVAVVAICGISTSSYAFHSGGVASCESCHTMHNSLTGLAMTGNKSTTASGVGNPANSAMFLLRGSDQSSTCLNCHEGPTKSSYHVSTDDATMSAASDHAPVNRGPGGDFGWLKSSTTTTTGVTTATLNRRGHNIVAADFGYNADTENTVAPGGTYVAANLNCISCHNPHNQLRRTDTSNTFVKPSLGNNVYAIASTGSTSVAASVTAPVGPYRFLRGAGADQAPVSTGYAFNFNPPAVVSPSTYNKSEGAVETHIAYGSGMSDWCANCHAAMNDAAGTPATNNTGHPHPVNKAIGTDMAAIYNAYKGSGDLTGGANGYSSLVPVEMDTTDYSALGLAAVDGAGSTYLAATATSKVMCLSCHRAHAGGFASMTRFNVAGNTTSATGDWVLASGMTSTAQAQAAYYDRTASTSFTANTKQLCNKCHAKD